ncbi:hypothetical protein ATCC90586_002353 [Pythium insidiosum]|nr:hypothetical protein ATCC90586_002353 [Pythium insidiosum]
MSLQVAKKSVVTSSKTVAKAMSTSATPYTERQARLGRPVSPHVTIYRFPITAVSSVTNRFTSVGLTAGFAAASGLAAVGVDIPSLIYAAQGAIPGFAPISKFFIAFPISYHSLAAARHVLWDIKPELINNIDGPKSSYAVFGAAGLISLGAAAYTIKADKEEDDADAVLLEAIAKQERVLRAMQQTHGEFHPSVSEDLMQLALLCNMSGDHEKALTTLHKRLVIHEKHGPDELTGETLQALGTTYRLRGAAELSLQHLERALVIRESCHGQHSYKVAETLNSLALLMNELTKAEELQLRSLQVVVASTEPEDIESEDVPWEVYKRLKQQRAPSTAANSITLLKGTLRQCVANARSRLDDSSNDEPEADVRDAQDAAVFFGAQADATPPRSPPALLSRQGRSHSDSAMERLRTELDGIHDLEGRLSRTQLEVPAQDSAMPSPTDESSSSQSAAELQAPPSIWTPREPSLSFNTSPAASTPTGGFQRRVYDPITNVTTLQQRVEFVKRCIVAGAPNMEMEIARLGSDVDLIASHELRQVGAAMVSLVREMNRMSLKSDRARQMPVLEGMLEKKSASIFRGWEKRWFTVDPKTFILSYHFSKDDFSRGFAPRGGFPVSRISNILVHRQPRGGHFHFDVVVDLSTRLNPHASRTYELRSLSDETLRYWVETLHYYKAMAQSSIGSVSSSSSSATDLRRAAARPGTS